MRELNYIAKRSGMEPKVKYNDDASGHSIGYISLAGHTFPDPRALEQMLQGMFQRSKELDVSVSKNICFKSLYHEIFISRSLLLTSIFTLVSWNTLFFLLFFGNTGTDV